MRLMGKILRCISHIVFKTNVLKTLYVNFKMLPIRQAVWLPVFVYGKTVFREMEGRLVIEANRLHPGMIKIGKRDYYVKTAVPLTCWIVNGVIVLHGSVNFLNGGYLCVARNAQLVLGDNTSVGSDYRIMCFEHIVIGKNCSIAYNVQFYDTSYHYVVGNDVEANKLTMAIVVGDWGWIGNNATIAKGAMLPNYSIVAAHSLVNKNFTSFGEEILLAGTPALVKRQRVHRIFDTQQEKDLDHIFGYDRTHL